jgi:hypothetical protein
MGARAPPVSRTGLISLFCLLDLAAALYANAPIGPATRAARAAERWLGPDGAARAASAGWALGRFAHLTGLGARWQLFGPLPATDYVLVLRAQWPDGRERTLDRPPWRRAGLLGPVVDHKQSKIETNLINRPLTRAPYGRYVCRWLLARGEAPPASVSFTLEHRAILRRADAARYGVARGADFPAAVLETVPCAPP